MIDRDYDHLARDGREDAIRLLDELSAEQRPTVDADGHRVDTYASQLCRPRQRNYPLSRQKREAL